MASAVPSRSGGAAILSDNVMISHILREAALNCVQKCVIRSFTERTFKSKDANIGEYERDLGSSSHVYTI